jgi:uncharacterized protein YprB with RNaseH-like and TPR domain
MIKKKHGSYPSEFRSFVIKRLNDGESHTDIAREAAALFDLDYKTHDSIRKQVSRTREEITDTSKPARLKRLFFDIETSPCLGWFWRPGWNQTIGANQIIEYAKVICISWKWEGDKQVHNLRWDEYQDDKKMLEKFAKVIMEADESVAHNGDRFDEKWLRTRFIYHRIPAMPKYKTLDTLKKAKSGFVFPSNKMDEIGKYLNVGRKMVNEPRLWEKVWQHNDRKALNRMVNYCDQDVLVLEAIFKIMNGYVTGNSNVNGITGGAKWRCPECASSDVKFKKSVGTAMGTSQRWFACNSCEKKYKISNKSYMKFLKFKMESN